MIDWIRLCMGMAVTGLLCPAQTRLTAVAQRPSESGTRSAFALVGTSGDPTALAADDGRYAVTAWLDNTPPAEPPPRVRIATELDFDVSTGGFAGAQIRSLRFVALAFFTGEEGSVAAVPPATDDSSEEDVLHAATVQLFDFDTGTWSDVGASLLDPAAYRAGLDRWRDSGYANRHCRAGSPSGPHPGPIDRARMLGFVDGHVSAAGIVRVRLVKDAEVSGGGWDVTHLLDDAAILVDAGSGPLRYEAVAHRATGDAQAGLVFAASGARGDVANLRQRDSVFVVSYWEDSQPLGPAPTPPVHQELWTELDFAVAQLPFALADAGSLRFSAALYSTGWHEVNPPRIPTGPPTGFDDSSEEWRIHDARVQVFDHARGAWDDLGPLFDPSRYQPTQVWRDSEYARSWSRPDPLGPTLGYPGPWRIDRGIAWRPGYANAQGIVRVRLWKDLQFDSYGSHDVVHALDYAWLELQPDGVVAFGRPCSGVAGEHPYAFLASVPDATNGNPGFAIELAGAAPGATANVMLSFLREPVPFALPGFPGCFLYPRLRDTSLGFVLAAPRVDPLGRSRFATPLQVIPGLRGVRAFAQWFYLDPRASVGLSDAVEITFR